MTQEQQFETALEILRIQVAEATQFWCAASAMNEVARLSPATLLAINLTPTFWITVRVGLEYQGILSIGKIFGPRKTNPHNIDSLFEVLRDGYGVVFSKEALAARKRRMSPNADEWLPAYMENVYVPTLEDVHALHAMCKPHRITYETQYEQIRNQHVAHTGIVDPNAKWEMFQKTSVPDLEHLIGFLNQWYEALWNLYFNGSRSAADSIAYSVRDLVAKPLADLRESKNIEHIVSETRKALALITHGAGR